MGIIKHYFVAFNNHDHDCHCGLCSFNVRIGIGVGDRASILFVLGSSGSRSAGDSDCTGDSGTSGITGERGSWGFNPKKVLDDFREWNEAGELGIGGSALRSSPSKFLVVRALDGCEAYPALQLPISMSE
jgi:hypothetical protein